jgi:hypothetical protein
MFGHVHARSHKSRWIPRGRFQLRTTVWVKSRCSRQACKRRCAGRPTKYSEEVVAKLCDALADGAPISGASAVAGIALSTLRIVCGSEPLKTLGSEQPVGNSYSPFVRCNLHRPCGLCSLPFGLPANCRTTLRFDARGTANSRDCIVLLTHW